MTEHDAMETRGYLVHITHYDPRWFARKQAGEEEPFQPEVALELIDALADGGFNLLVIDCADGVRYRSHPELRRPYSVPMEDLEALVGHARDRGMEIVPKLNFSKSDRHRHNWWFRPHRDLPDDEQYWRIAFEVIDELIGICRPERFFHVGMDEDTERSPAAYADAIRTLHGGLAERGLRTLIWNDSCLRRATSMRECAEKSMAAETEIPTDVVPIVWSYRQTEPEALRRLRELGFTMWGAPGGNPENVRQWREDLLRHGGAGMLMTHWVGCVEAEREELLGRIRELAPCYGGQGAG